MTARIGFKAALYNEQSAAKHLKIASVAMHCDREPDVNRSRIASTIKTIMQANPDVELIFFGEMTLGWYNPGRFPEYHRSISESIPGETTQMLASLALDYKVYILGSIRPFGSGVFFPHEFLRLAPLLGGRL
jgi:predicted amidohydrolase